MTSSVVPYVPVLLPANSARTRCTRAVPGSRGGDVTVRFPPAGDSRVEATSRMARIESSLAKVLVMEGGESAQGVVGDGGRELRTVFIKASGEVKLLGPDAPASSGETP